MNQDLSNYLLYYFSAVAQVLAALVGLAGVFLVFFIQSLNVRIEYWSKNMHDSLYTNSPPNPSPLDIILRDFKNAYSTLIIKDIEKNFNLLKDEPKFKNQNSILRDGLDRYSANLDNHFLTRRKSISYFKGAFITSSCTIIVSLAFIMISYFDCKYLNIIAVVMTLIASIITLYLIYKIIAQSFS